MAAAPDILRYRTPRRISENRTEGRLEEYDLASGCPLTPSQMNVYNDIMSGTDHRAYLIPFDVAVPEGMSAAEARDALDRVIGAHPVLSCTVGEGPVLIAGERVRAEIVGEMPDAPLFDLRGRLSRFTVVEGSPPRIVGFMSHLVSDGMSVDILSQEILKVLSGGEPVPEQGFLTRPSLQPGRMARSKAFCDSMLADADSVPQPVPLSVSPRGRAVKFALEGRFSEYCRGKGISAGSFLTAAFAYALSRFNGSDRAVFCTMYNGREIPQHQNAVGMFVRTVPLCIDCSECGTDVFLSRAHDTVTSAMSECVSAMDEYLREYGVRQNIVFQLLTGPSGEFYSDGGEVDHPLKRDISFYARQDGPSVAVDAVFSSRFSALADPMCRMFEAVVSGLMSCGRLSDIVLPYDDSPKHAVAVRPNTFPTLIDAYRAAVS